MEKWLIFIPVVKNHHVLIEAVEQVLHKRGIHLIILLNGADQEVIDAVHERYIEYPQVTLWQNDVNCYVTGAWNMAIGHFLAFRAWDRLFIMNSDITLNKSWDLVLREIWKHAPDLIITPNIIDDKTLMYQPVDIEDGKLTELDNPAGVFITLTKKQAELISPIPSEIRIWFNDAYIHSILKAAGYRIVMPSNFLGYHHVSTTIHRVENALEIIEEDKAMWRDIVEPLMQEKIKQLKDDKR